jgi:inner membrane protein
MPSSFSHGVAALALGSLFSKEVLPRRFWLVGATCAMAPDLDVIGYSMKIPYDHILGHRGFTHSIFFAVLLSAFALALIAVFRNHGYSRGGLFTYLLLCTLSHGLLDAMTTGGLGVAFFSPFDTSRYFLPWRPIAVSPLSFQRFFSRSGLRVVRNEFFFVGMPSLLLMTATTIYRKLQVMVTRDG